MDETPYPDRTQLVLTLPLDRLPASALVDALHLAAGTRRVLRTRLLAAADAGAVLDWCRRCGLAGRVDGAGYLFVGLVDADVDRAAILDASTSPHEKAFGTLLGYPACCCNAIAAVGEQAIDEYALSVAEWDFAGPYRIIDPSGYAGGLSLICHLPCSPTCGSSLLLARTAASYLTNSSALSSSAACRHLQGWYSERWSG